MMLAPPAAVQHAVPDFWTLPAGVAARVLNEYRRRCAGVGLQGQANGQDKQMVKSILLHGTAALPATWSRTLVRS